jgi:hypothetical protein
MHRTPDDGLKAIRESAELAEAIRIELSSEYLQLIAFTEAMPENQSGAEKPSRWRGRPDREIRRGYFMPDQA